MSRRGSMAQRVSLQPNLAAQYEISSLPDAVQDWVRYWYDVVTPDSVRICDGSKTEAEDLQNLMLASGQLQKVTDPRYENCWYCCTDPADVARVESKTVISTRRQSETIPYASEGVQGRLGRWMNPAQLEEQLESRTPNCMVGRTMYRAEFMKLCVSSQFSFSSSPVIFVRFLSKPPCVHHPVFNGNCWRQFVKSWCSNHGFAVRRALSTRHGQSQYKSF